MREYHVRICEGLGVKFPGPTRHKELSHAARNRPQYPHKLPNANWPERANSAYGHPSGSFIGNSRNIPQADMSQATNY